jgi:hypothetical protein
MFFKRQQPKQPAFEEQMEQLKAAGYDVFRASEKIVVRRANFAAVLKQDALGRAGIEDSGLALGDEVALLTDVGFQKIFLTPSGRKAPALADHLKGLHAFVEDLREALGLTSLYNESLGTTNELHLYDRVWRRDSGHQPKPWEKRQSPG